MSGGHAARSRIRHCEPVLFYYTGNWVTGRACRLERSATNADKGVQTHSLPYCLEAGRFLSLADAVTGCRPSSRTNFPA